MGRCGSIREAGFTLIELTIVLVIIGIIISIMATVLPSLIESGKIKKTRAVLEQVEYAVQGYLTANGRLPFADSDTDGQGDTGVYFGNLPFRDLGLSSGDDVWGNRIKYGVYSDLTAATTTTLCNVLANAGTAAFDSGKLYITQNGTQTHQAYVIVSGGLKDRDGSNGFFDGLNGDDDAQFDDPDQVITTSYDDLMRTASFMILIGRNCTAGSGGSGSGGSSENCSNGVDDDGDALVDCEDPDCASDAQCLAAPTVTIVQNIITSSRIGANLSHSFQATGGESAPDYYWYLESVPAELSGKISLNLWSGTLTGTLDVCHTGSPYAISVKAADRTNADNYDRKNFDITVITGTLTLSPPSASLPDPDFTVNASTFSQEFTVSGDYVGPFEELTAWSLNWTSANPGGFQMDPLGGTQAKFWKSGTATAGDYTFTITATDDSCPANHVTSGPYSLRVTAEGTGAPYTANLSAEWHLDECSWNGTEGEVRDSGDEGLHGTAMNGATTLGSGRNCRAGYFDGVDNYIEVEDNAELQKTGALTLALWVKVHGSASDWVRLAGKGNSTNRNYGLWLATNGTILFQIYSDGGYGNAQTSVTVNDGKWHHVVGVYNQATMKVYIDNQERASINYTENPRTSADPFTMGYAGFHAYLNGLLDEVMLFHKALTPEEVQEIYEITRSVCSGSCYTVPLADYQMENYPWNGTAGEVVDSGTGASNGVAAGQGSGVRPTQTTPSAGKICRSAVLTRVDDDNGGYLDAGDPADGDLDPGASPWTMSAWIKWDGSSGDNIIYNKENLYEARVQSGFLNYAWQPHWVWDGGSTYTVTADTWTYLTTVYDGHQQILYKDGVQVYARSQTGAIGGNSSKLLVGARGNTVPRNFFGGMIDEVKIYDRALAENEIKTEMETTRDCSANTVVITSTALPGATLGQSNYSSHPEPSAEGGTPPYVWEIISQGGGLNLTLPNVTTGVVEGAIGVCAGEYDVTLRVTDNNSRIDEATLPLVVSNGVLGVSSLPSILNCTSTTCSWNFSVTGPMVGPLENWILTFQGTDPGGFEVVSTGANTATVRKIGTSSAGTGYKFKLSARDGTCTSNTLDTGPSYTYTLNIDASAMGTPYYAGLQAEWRLDECLWNGTSGEVTDASGNGLGGTAVNGVWATGAGRLCQGGFFNGTDGYLNMGDILNGGNALGDASTAFTVALWVNPESLGSTVTNHGTANVIFAKASDAVNDNLEIGINPNGTVHLYLDAETKDATGDFGNAGDVGLHAWSFIGVTYESGVVAVTINGNRYENTTTWNGATDLDAADGSPVTIGSSQHTDNYFHGLIDEVMIWGRALNAADLGDVRTRSRTSCAHICYNPVGEWRMDGCATWNGTAGEVLDSIGTAHGFAVNMDNRSGGNRQTGKICRGGALNLGDTTNQYLHLGSQAFQNLDDFTLSLWFRVEDLSSNLNTLFSGASSSTGDNTMLIYLNAVGNALLTHLNGTQTGYFNIGGSVQDRRWHHLVWSRKAADGMETVYVDGTALTDTNGSTGTGSVSLSSGGAMIGQEQDSVGGGFASNQRFRGWIDEVRIFNRLLTHQEVLDLDDLTRACSDICYTSATGYYKMDNDWTDSSGNGHPDGSPSADGLSFTAGCDGWAAAFDKSQNGTVGFGGLTELSALPAPGGKATVTFWMKWDGADNEIPLHWEGQSYGFWLRNYGAGDRRFGFNTLNSDLFGIVDMSDPPAIAGRWIHIAAVFENRAVYSSDPAKSRNDLYINGVLQPADLVGGATILDRTVGAVLRLSGRNATDTTYSFDGLIDELRIYDRGLSASEVLTDMNLSEPCVTVWQSQ
ncbi:MAG: prepilin-type N-terminal cleavage/methylation domain-containing protein [Deltaproteobacteria bacterium]|nr:prepilin-type N-terminal cleavage/methylation domain-containing protein [Deltaproteobacteria bacterium]